MAEREKDTFEQALLRSWKAFREKLPGGLGEYLDPKTAFEKVIKQNGAAVLLELKESREALILLFRVAGGGSLTAEEQARLKSQLADFARTVPALGIFALPGGSLLLPILAKSLPWSLLPSAFRRELEKGSEREGKGKKG